MVKGFKARSQAKWCTFVISAPEVAAKGSRVRSQPRLHMEVKASFDYMKAGGRTYLILLGSWLVLGEAISRSLGLAPPSAPPPCMVVQSCAPICSRAIVMCHEVTH